MMTPARGLIALGVAFTAGLSLTMVVVDSPDDGQRIETAQGVDATESSSAVDPGTEEQPLLVAMADTDDRTILSVTDEGGSDTSAPPAARATIKVETAETAPAATDTATTEAADTPDPVSTTEATAATGPSTTGRTPASSGSPADNAAPARSETAAAPTTEPSTNPTTNPTTAAKAGGGAATTAAASGSGSGSGGTAAAPTTNAPTTDAPTTAAPSTQAPASPAPAPSGNGSGAAFESIRNRDPNFNRYASVPESGISLDALTEPAPRPDNGAHPDGNFRMACNYSHFSYDDPIVFPGQPGKSHLHMFFGNTQTDAYTTTNSLVNSGGGSCNGFELNRSGYWTPALLDGKGNIVVPDSIILYYKTKRPSETVAMPQGLKMVAGNPRSESFTADQRLGWGCGGSGTTYSNTNRIPNNCGSDPVNFHIQFPFCWDGKNLDSADHMSHMAYADSAQPCPSSHPVRLPQITILAYYPPGNTSGWYLSSDRSNGFNSGPGATLHGDWFGGWNDAAMNLWVDGCIRASRNCSFGQTGTSRQFAKLNPLQKYEGSNFLPLP